MRSRNALTQLAAAASQAELLVGPDEEDLILERILASPREAARRRKPARVRVAVTACAVGAFAGAIAVASTSGEHHSHRLALTGSKLALAGYRFRTPAGFTASSNACASSPAAGQPTTVLNGLSAAASAEGGCIEAAIMFSTRGSAVPAGATPVAVGAYQGYLVSPAGSDQTTLYVVLPALGGEVKWQAVVLESQGLTADQLVAIAQSGLPAKPSGTVG